MFRVHIHKCPFMCSYRCAFLTALKISKLVLTTVGYAQVQVVAEACQSESTGNAAQITITPVMHNHAVILQKALQCVPNPNTDFMMRNTATRLGQFLTRQVTIEPFVYILFVCFVCLLEESAFRGE